MKLVGQTLVSMAFGVLFFGLAVFLPARTLDYWQAWVFIAVFMVATLVPSLYLAVQHPAALQRRLKADPTAETRRVQRIGVGLLLAQLVVVQNGHAAATITAELAGYAEYRRRVRYRMLPGIW